MTSLTTACPTCRTGLKAEAQVCPACGWNLHSASVVGPQRRHGFDFAPAWRRGVALLIDGGLLGVPGGGLMFGVGVVLDSTAPGVLDDFAGIIFPALTFLSWLAMWPYFAGLESSPRQATLGKMAMGLIVVDPLGQRISFGRATARHFAKMGLLMCCWPLAAGFAIVTDDTGQEPHDLAADTFVVLRN